MLPYARRNITFPLTNRAGSPKDRKVVIDGLDGAYPLSNCYRGSRTLVRPQIARPRDSGDNSPMSKVQLKTCIGCQKELSLDNFYTGVDTRLTSGIYYMPRCRACTSERNKQKRKERLIKTNFVPKKERTHWTCRRCKVSKPRHECENSWHCKQCFQEIKEERAATATDHFVDGRGRTRKDRYFVKSPTGISRRTSGGCRKPTPTSTRDEFIGSSLAVSLTVSSQAATIRQRCTSGIPNFSGNPILMHHWRLINRYSSIYEAKREVERLGVEVHMEKEEAA